MIDFLNKERYGIWLTVTSILTWFNFFDIGLGNGLRNKLTEALANKDYRLAKIYISTTYALITFIFITLLIIFYIVSPFIGWDKVLNTTHVDPHELFLLMIVVFTFFVLRLIFKLIGNIYYAFQRPAITSSFGTIGNIISLVIIYILIKLQVNGNLIIISFILGSVPLLVLITFTFIAFFSKYRFIRPSLKYIDLKYRKELIGLGFKFFIIQIAAVVIYASSNFIVIQFFSPTEVTRYNIVYKYFQIPLMLFTLITTPYWSSVTDAYTKKDFHWLKKQLLFLNKISILFVAGIIIFTLLSPYILKIWIGERINIPFNLILPMSIYTILRIVRNPYSYFINGLGKLKISTIILIISIIVFIPISFLFIKTTGQSSGVIYAAIVVLILSLFFAPIQVYKILNNKERGIWNK